MRVEHSRALLLAERATGQETGELESRLEDAIVVVGADGSMHGSALTARVLLTTLRRLPGRLILDRGNLTTPVVNDLVEAVVDIDPERGLEVFDNLEEPMGVRLQVGTTAPNGAIRVVPEGYGAHLASDSDTQIRPSRAGNPLGAVFAGALGAAEAFKHVAAVLPGRRRLHRHLRFCPVTLSADLGAAPDLPEDLSFDLGLVGVGAVGTGVALILGELNAGGKVLLVDFERYGPENCGTYSLGGAREARQRPWKVDVAATVLEGRYNVARFRGSVEDLAGTIDSGKAPWPGVILSGLDSIEARHAAQRLWPDRLIDAATGDTMLGLHDVRTSAPCLMCFLPLTREGPSSTELLVEATGLSKKRAMHGDDPLTEEDLAGLDENQRERLSPYLGKPVCGLAQAIGLTGLEADGYQPAVPFVSLQAACLGVGRLLAGEFGMDELPNFVQYDALAGPEGMVLQSRRAKDGCYCQERAETVMQVRDLRGHIPRYSEGG